MISAECKFHGRVITSASSASPGCCCCCCWSRAFISHWLELQAESTESYGCHPHGLVQRLGRRSRHFIVARSRVSKQAQAMMACMIVWCQYTPPTPTRRNCFVASRRRCVHEFATSSRRLPTDLIDSLETGQTDSIAVWRTTWNLIDTDNFFNSYDIMTSLLKKLSIFIKIGVIKRYGVCLVSFKLVDRIRRQSSWIVFTPPTRRNSTVSSRRRRRCVLGLREVQFIAQC